MSLHEGGFDRDALRGRAGQATTSVLERRLAGQNGGRRDGRPAELERAAARTNTANSGFWLPDWVRDHAEHKSSVRDLAEDATRRALDSPREETLLEVQAVFNELGRSPENAHLLKEAMKRAGQLVSNGGRDR